jgi:prepilin-type processing-associated H-X9-DG protein
MRDSLPSVNSPAATGVAVALLLPAVQAAREAARRAQCVNNLKQIGLAFHNHLSMTDAFPSNIVDKDGKPLLSWRVAILPFIEQQELYNEFKLDEPWDSPHNKPLMSRIPTTYHCPSNPPTDPTLTNYLGFEGAGAILEKGRKVGIAGCTDGTSNTLAVVESARGVPWTKPEDLPFDPEAKPSLYGALSKHAGGFNALFADGSVRFLKQSIRFLTLKSLITRAGGEVIGPGAF